MTRTVLLTGASGFLGGHLAAALAARGWAVRGLARDPARSRARCPAATAWVGGDLLDADVVAAALDGVVAVVHAAALVSFRERDADACWRVNATGTARLVAAARAAGVATFLQVSSVAALGAAPPGSALDEHAALPLAACDVPYAASKRAADAAVQAAATAGLDARIVLPVSLFGPGVAAPTAADRDSLVGAVVRGRVPLAPPGWLTVADVRDVAASCVRALEHDGRGRRWLLGGEVVRGRVLLDRAAAAAGVRGPRATAPGAVLGPLAWLAGLGCAAVGAPRWPALLDPQMLRLAGRRFAYDDARARAELGHAPRPLEETLRDTVAWLRGGGA